MAEALAASKARSLAMGTVEIEGHVSPLGKVFDPIYQKPCGCYKITVKELQQRGKSSEWVTIHEVASTQPFSLLDATGSIIILPLKVDWEESLTLNEKMGVFSSSNKDAAVVNYLSQFKRAFYSLKVEAFILREGDPLFVMGFAQPIDFQQPQHAAITLQEAARLLKSEKNRFSALDVNHDGQVDDQEWEAGLKNFKEELDRKAAQGKSISGLTKNIGVTPSPNVPLVFGRSRKDLISKTNNQFILMTAFGSALILLAAAFLALNGFSH